MKRALVVLVACIGFGAFAQFPAVTGSWSATVCILSSTSLTSDLSLTTNIAGFDVTGAFRFTGGGLTRASFTAKGGVGPLSLTSGMYFDPSNIVYMGGYLATTLDLAGLGIDLGVYHWDRYYNDCFFDPTASICWPYLNWGDGMTGLCSKATQTASSFGMLYKLGMKIDPLTVKLYFVDCCEGIEFYKALITLEGIGLCCGISLDAELSFLKEKGFDYIKFSGINIPLCCDVSVDLTVKFTTTAKILEPKLKFGGFGDACFTVYGDAQTKFVDKDNNGVYDPGVDTFVGWGGIDIYGWKIKCTIADCNYVEFLTALDVDAVEDILGDIFSASCGEFEYVKFGFCGAGCCGGQYSVSLAVYFGAKGGLFDITRLVYSVKIPIMTNFTLNISGTAAAASCASNSFCFGWTFSF